MTNKLFQFEEYLTFDDVSLVPQYNNIKSRLDVDTSTWITQKKKVGIPLLASNMDTVIGDEMAEALIEHGSIPIFHRFCSIEQQLKWVNKYKENCFFSAGVNDYDNVVKLFDAGAGGVVFDVAHGHSEVMMRLIRKVKKQFPKRDVIAGNVCTCLAYNDMVSAGADAVKVGIGPGAACTTRITTGFGLPQFSCILKIGDLAKKLRVPIIADGGIRYPKDMVLALAAGASTVMCGSLFAKTRESACEKKKVVENGKEKWIGRYRGQASKEFQVDFFGKMKKNTAAEGIAFEIDCTRTVQDVVTEFVGGYRSALTYAGSKNIKELQRKAEFVRVTPTFSQFAHPRPSKN